MLCWMNSGTAPYWLKSGGKERTPIPKVPLAPVLLLGGWPSKFTMRSFGWDEGGVTLALSNLKLKKNSDFSMRIFNSGMGGLL